MAYVGGGWAKCSTKVHARATRQGGVGGSGRWGNGDRGLLNALNNQNDSPTGGSTKYWVHVSVMCASLHCTACDHFTARDPVQ
jgi:hypothetical protein